MQEKIEILPVSLLDQHRTLVNELKDLAKDLRLEFGWHYLLDLTWILSQMALDRRIRVMDAGAGIGVMQWYLAQKGAEVVSVDRLERAYLPLRFRLRFHVRGLRKIDLKPVILAYRYRRGQVQNFLKMVANSAIDILENGFPKRPEGRVLIYSQDLGRMPDIPDNSLDYIVGVSALEHNSPDDLNGVVSELIRVLKPGGRLLVTLAASPDQDWYHQPSKGWCYTDETLRRAFGLSSYVPSNYDRYAELFAELQDSEELRNNLAEFYFQSGENGMPWGVWDPKYQPVGVSKVKDAGG
ncbi:MAG TPA: class I SAM-dependent methyltransferase [Anaerolineales bacterium]